MRFNVTIRIASDRRCPAAAAISSHDNNEMYRSSILGGCVHVMPVSIDL